MIEASDGSLWCCRDGGSLGRFAHERFERGELGDRATWQRRPVCEVLGLAADGGAVPALAPLLRRLPSEGELETALEYDELIGEVATTLRRIGDPAGAAPLLRFAAATSPRMRKAWVVSALTVAMLAPARGDAAVRRGMLELMTKINDSDENTAAPLAYGLIGRAQPEGEHGRWGAELREGKPMAHSYLEVQAARAIALQMLGSDGAEEDGAAAAAANALVRRVLGEPSWKEEYTLRRRRWGVKMPQLMAGTPGAEIDSALLEPLLALGDEELATEAAAALTRGGGTGPATRSLSWFEAA